MTSQAPTQGPTDAGLTARVLSSEWQTMETAPKDADIFVWYDHDADKYVEDEETGRLTDYAALVEGGTFLAGSGFTIAKWQDRQWESEDEYGSGFWLPAGWFSKGDDKYYEVVCNAIYWVFLPTPPTNPKGAA